MRHLGLIVMLLCTIGWILLARGFFGEAAKEGDGGLSHALLGYLCCFMTAVFGVVDVILLVRAFVK